MKAGRNISGRLSAVLAAAALVLVAAALVLPHKAGDLDHAARRCEHILEKRLALLEYYSERPGMKIPQDMVIYRYQGDTLQSWRNQFPVSNDAISSTIAIQRLVNFRAGIQSPLADVGTETGFFNFGPKWYLAKMIPEGDAKTLIGLEIRSGFNPGFNGTNPKLRLNENFSVKPISSSEGSEVRIDGRPMFKIVNETIGGNVSADATFVCLAFLLFLAAVVLRLLSTKNLKGYAVSASGLVIATAAICLWGHYAQDSIRIFSPSVYAGGQILFSLGTVLLVNMAIALLVAGMFLIRQDLASHISSRRSMVAVVIAGFLAVAGILVYASKTLRSIVLDSSISLDLYKFSEFSLYSFLVYLSFIALLISVPLVLQMIQPAFSRLRGRHLDMLDVKSRIAFSIMIAAYLVISGAQFGFDKEKARLSMWANRLAIERDITLELQLRRVENIIASDPIVSSLMMLDNTEGILQNRIVENYLLNAAQYYDISVRKVDDHDRYAVDMGFLNKRIQEGVPIANESRFLYTEAPGMSAVYTGVFLFLHEQLGISRLIVSIEPKAGALEGGYSALLGISVPGRMNLPAGYSYARYVGRDLKGFKGNFPYPTKVDEKLAGSVFDGSLDYMESEGQAHFINVVSDDEAVVISRSKVNVVNFLIAMVCIAFLAFFLLTLVTLKRRTEPVMVTNHYKTRITWVLMISLLLTLVAMATVSVVFVYRRNDSNLKTIMSDRINSVQALVQDGLRSLHGQPDFNSPELVSMVRTVGVNTSSDITLYRPDGLVVLTTTPDMFDRQILGIRINEDALENILTKNKRYHIQREKIGAHSIYSMYAPLLGPDGKIVAILCTPYAEEHYDFERDAVMHSMTIITLFLILLIIARFMTSAVIDRMFKPLSEMGRKMSRAGLDSLELIEYDSDDEITALVQSYNRMVHELSESSKQLAQAERDKAWSGMARQVAHEIKNPLTPMKLQIQRLIRLKAKDAPDWESKFDEVSKILLDHIDILTDTANEFSTFAKLYSEDPIELDLDAMLQEEIAMFDNREEITMDYLGMQDAMVEGPKPQLTRVFVNLIGNAVQAVDGQADANVRVSLRNSTVEGYYDIVVEDNGPGVSDDNVEKLFTPNFTTKSGGSGLGLAISHSILERCGATIRYSRSFALGGACFTVTYPKL